MQSKLSLGYPIVECLAVKGDDISQKTDSWQFERLVGQTLAGRASLLGKVAEDSDPSYALSEKWKIRVQNSGRVYRLTPALQRHNDASLSDHECTRSPRRQVRTCPRSILSQFEHHEIRGLGQSKLLDIGRSF